LVVNLAAEMFRESHKSKTARLKNHGGYHVFSSAVGAPSL
jgi:hypothetical protein